MRQLLVPQSAETTNPAVLPMQGKPGEDRDGRKHSEQRSIRQTVQSTHHRRPTGDASCR